MNTLGSLIPRVTLYSLRGKACIVLHALLQRRKKSSNLRHMGVVGGAEVVVQCLNDWEAFNLRPQSCIVDYNSTTESVLHAFLTVQYTYMAQSGIYFYMLMSQPDNI